MKSVAKPSWSSNNDIRKLDPLHQGPPHTFDISLLQYTVHAKAFCLTLYHFNSSLLQTHHSANGYILFFSIESSRLKEDEGFLPLALIGFSKAAASDRLWSEERKGSFFALMLHIGSCVPKQTDGRCLELAHSRCSISHLFHIWSVDV